MKGNRKLKKPYIYHDPFASLKSQLASGVKGTASKGVVPWGRQNRVAICERCGSKRNCISGVVSWRSEWNRIFCTVLSKPSKKFQLFLFN